MRALLFIEMDIVLTFKNTPKFTLPKKAIPNGPQDIRVQDMSNIRKEMKILNKMLEIKNLTEIENAFNELISRLDIG